MRERGGGEERDRKKIVRKNSYTENDLYHCQAMTEFHRVAPLLDFIDSISKAFVNSKVLFYRTVCTCHVSSFQRVHC